MKTRLTPFISFLILLSQLLVSTSCSLYIQFAHTPPQKPKLLKQVSPSSCSIEKGEQFALESQLQQTQLQTFLQRANKYWAKLDFIEKAVLFSLMQMNFAPHLSSPSAQLYVLVNYHKQDYFAFTHHDPLKKNIDQKPSSPHWPFLSGLDSLLQAYQSPKRLEQLAGMLDSHFPQKINVDDDLAHFISQNKNQLLAHSLFADNLFKANHPVSRGETIPKINFSKIIRAYRKKIKKHQLDDPITSNYLFNHNLEESRSDISIRCNYDFNLYQNSIFLIASKPSLNYAFAFQDSDGNSFMAIATQGYENISPLADTFVIEGTPPQDTLAMCFIKNKLTSKDISLISFTERDPGQFLYHLILYNIFEVKEIEELTAFINFPRHLFLMNPVRMIYESERGSSEQLNRFLSLNFPIYHYEPLGHIWSHLRSDTGDNSTGFVLDNRYESGLQCQ